MICPSCERDLVSTLSVCPSCGTMMNDSIREELALKITPLPKNHEIPARKFAEKSPAPVSQRLTEVKRPQTTEIMSKPTSPTLIDFQYKNASMPEWRLQLQNAVRMRNGRTETIAGTGLSLGTAEAQELPTNGATALKPDYKPETSEGTVKNQAVLNALKRIEASRQKYLIEESTKPRQIQFARPNPPVPYTVAKKGYDFNSIQDIHTTETDGLNASLLEGEVTPKIRQFDTNKLPPMPLPAKLSTSFDRQIAPREESIEITDAPEIIEIEEKPHPEVIAYQDAAVAEEIIETPEIQEYEEFDDCAPFSLRINSAIFDLLICSFASFVLLSPFMIMSGRLFSIEGMFAFIAVCAIVTFIYMTTTIGLTGRTYGMRLFSLEIIDAEENDYPTLHQAAVSSSLYIASLATMGLGFLPALFTTERRTFHDLMSGTVIIKEYD